MPQKMNDYGSTGNFSLVMGFSPMSSPPAFLHNPLVIWFKTGFVLCSYFPSDLSPRQEMCCSTIIMMSLLHRAMFDTLQSVTWTLLKWPLETLYRKGPRIFYFWEGLSEENICYELTNIDALFWSSSVDSASACEELISRKFEAFVISVYGFLLVYAAYTFFCIKVYEYVFVSRLNALLRGGRKSLSIRDLDLEDAK